MSKFYYKTKDISTGKCARAIEIGPYDRGIYTEYNNIFWEYVKNCTIPKMLTENTKEEEKEFSAHPLEIRLMIMEIYKYEQWKKDIDKWKSDLVAWKQMVHEWEKNMKIWSKNTDPGKGVKTEKPNVPVKPFKPLIREMPTKFETIAEMVTSELYNQIDEINFGNCHLTNLPMLPENLVILKCYHNALAELPRLPHTLRHLDISYNNFIILPDLPPNLEYLSCTHNFLEFIGQLPNSLIHLYCCNNNLKYLPELGPREECKRGMCYGDFSPSKNESVPCLHYKLSFVSCAYNPLESFPESFKKCMKCEGQNIKLWNDYTDRIYCGDCSRVFAIDCYGLKIEKLKKTIQPPWEFVENTSLGRIIQNQFDGNIAYYLVNGDNMEVDGGTSGEDDGPAINYDGIV